ncbi:uncharacterized protein SPSK_03559 [Sporothrix schenckii 1099-18]|uniref:Uncharacterized protein n=1 Tax=Sporothrix schenckii 1099-18 TaxID=1397361 RepID=A0A0F2M2F6_SPOSC|nr:uncharacterized protein SPSK_03559 [Sporothrix schenckii 1099-18]KJR82316.1 hypothetical protein SPSK_03559 [Sporothrix schenckii 1099-18]
MAAAWRHKRIVCHVSKAASTHFLPSVRPRAASIKVRESLPRSQSTASPSPPLIYPDQPRSVKHNDLSSFLRYAERAGLDTGSTTYVGTHYEYTVADHLALLGFSLRRVGGASDRGIDLLGTWALPIPKSTSELPQEPLRAIVQCKAGAGQRVGPHLVRELEGAFIGAPVGWRSRVGDSGSLGGHEGGDGTGSCLPVIGILVTEKPATKGVRDALSRSRWPMAYIYCASAGHVRQMLWNQQAEKTCGLTGLGVTLRHASDEYEGAYTHIVLTWQGKPLPAATEQDS